MIGWLAYGIRMFYVLDPAFGLECVRGNCEWKNTCLAWRSGCLQPWWLSIFATLELLAMKKLSQTKICSDRMQSTKQRREQSWRNTCSLSSKMSTRCWAVFVHCRRNLDQWWLSIFATLELLAMKKLSQTKICSDRIQSTKQRREQSWRNTCSLSSKMSTRCWAVFVHCRRNLDRFSDDSQYLLL